MYDHSKKSVPELNLILQTLDLLVWKDAQVLIVIAMLRRALFYLLVGPDVKTVQACLVFLRPWADNLVVVFAMEQYIRLHHFLRSIIDL